MKTLLAAGAVLATLLSVGSAQAADIQALDNGFYRASDGDTPSNDNTYTKSFGDAYQSSYAFDLTGSAVATSISITFYGGNGEYISADPDEAVGL